MKSNFVGSFDAMIFGVHGLEYGMGVLPFALSVKDNVHGAPPRRTAVP
jgi:hypothetical protein